MINGTDRVITACTMNKALIYLEFVKWDVTQLQQGRVTGTKIVYRQAEALQTQAGARISSCEAKFFIRQLSVTSRTILFGTIPAEEAAVAT